MSLAIQVEIRDTATPTLAAILAGLEPQRLNPVIGEAGSNVVRQHVAALSNRPNKLGGPSTRYWEKAADSTSWVEVGDGVVISVGGDRVPGLPLHFFGGDVYPGKSISRFTGRPTRYLTIPARAEAHGTTASEHGELVVLWGRHGPYALAAASDYLRVIRRGKRKGQLVTGVRKDLATNQREEASHGGGGVLFWLTDHAHHEPDPTILPTEQKIRDAVVAAIEDYVDGLQSTGQIGGSS